MVPLIELRGAIPIGLGMGLPILPTYLVCVVGNMIPVPFIYLFGTQIPDLGLPQAPYRANLQVLHRQGRKRRTRTGSKAGRGLVVALLLFVGIPLPAPARGPGRWRARSWI